MPKKVIPIKADPDRCEICRFLLIQPGALVGECRRYPPTPVCDEGVAACICPQMGVSDWCGEFSRRLNS